MITRSVIAQSDVLVRPEPPISNSRLAMLLFVMSEAMLFAGLVTGYVVLGFGSGDFAGMREMPLGLTPYATLVLAASSAALVVAHRAMLDEGRRASRFTTWALLLGVLFLALQAIEWTQLVGVGILPETGVNSGMLYVIGGMHALHVVGGLVILAILVARTLRSPRTGRTRGFATVASLYWHFVTIVWLTLFTMMYVL